MPSISKDGSTVEQNKDIESRNELLNAQGKFNKDVAKKKEESKTVPSLPEKDKPENDKEVKSDSAPGWMSPLANKIASDENANIPEMPKPEIPKKDEAEKKPSVGKRVAGGAETAYMNVALGAADAVSSIANSLEQALGDAASGGAYSDGFKVLGEYFSAMPQEMRSDVLLNLSAEGMPKRGAYLADVSKKTGVPSNLILQYAKSAQNETMREELANSGYSQYVNPNTREKIANVSFSIGQQIPGLMLSGSLSGASAVSSGIAKSIGANPSTVLIGMSAAGNKTFELAREKGYNPSLYAEALVQGGIEMILEGAIGFSDLPSYAKRFANTGSSVGNVAKAFVRYIIGGAEEGIEEVLNVPLSNLASRAFGSDKKFGFGEGEIFDWKAMVESGLNGLTVGLIMGGVTGTALAVSGAKEGTDIRANAEWLNNMAQKLPEHYRPADTIDATKATAEDVEAYGKELTNAFKEYMTDSMNGNAVVNNKDLYGEDVASVTEDNAIVQLGDQAEVLAHVQADDTEGAKEIIDQKIQRYTEMAAAVDNDSSLQELGGEGTSEKIASNIAHLNETKGMIENGNYNADAAQKAIAAGLKEKIAEGKKTTVAANKFAESVKNSLGVTRGERAIAHTIELLEGDVKNGVKGASQQLKVARKALASIRNAPSSAVRSLLGASEKTLGKAISDDSKKRSVQLDYSMPENSYASYNRNTGEVKVNPIAILRAQNQMDNGNKARSEFVHEAGHIAAQMDASFVSKVYDVYAQLRDSGIIPQFGEDGINENEIREAYKKDRSLTNYLNTATVKAGVKQLMEQGATLEQAQSGFVDAFLKEEVAMHFLSYAENHGAKLFDTIVPEKRNAFVQAMQKIAQFFREIAAKIRKQDPASAKKMDSLADKLYNAVAGYAGGSTTAQERTNAKTTENTGNTNSEATEGLTGTHTEDERKSIATGNYARSEYEDVEDERYSLITSESTDTERARILSEKTIINPPTASDLTDNSEISSWEDIDRLFGKEKRAIIKKLAREFGVFKGYDNEDINLSFEFSVNNYEESYSKQKRNYKQFAKMLSVFDGVIEKAVGIEVHLRDDYKKDATLKNVYVLMSAYEDGDNIVPVKLEVKEFHDKQNTLYVAVALDGIKKTEVSGQGNTENGVTQNSRSVTISITDLMRNVNPSAVNFTKYFPKELLTKKQADALDSDDTRYSKDTSFTKDKYFDRQIDKWSELRENSYVKVGVIKSNSALHAVGVPTGGLYFDVSKMKTAMQSHDDHLTEGDLKGIPDLLNNPIVLTEYKPGTNSNTVSVYGNMFVNGVPVVVGVVMTRGRGGSIISKVRTVHARGTLNTQITDNSVLYLGENKKETNAWFQACGIDVPLGGTQLGVIRSIDFNDSVPQPEQKVNTSDEDSRSSLVLDSAYMSAVNRGDMAEVQRMVDEAARAAGYNYHLYHGTDADFTKFDLRKFGGRNGKGEGYGIYLAANREISAPYGKNVINSYTKFNRLAEGRKRTLTKAEVKKIIQKSCEIEARRMVDDGEYDSIAEAIKDTWVSNYVYTYDYPNMSRVYTDVADIVFGGNDNDGEIINEIMSASGGHYNYDGALDFYENVLTPTTGIDGFHYIWGNADGSGVQNDIYLAFSSEQIKSADPITYDDNGNVIPLSERFKESNDDIRYSKVEDLEKKIARLKEDKGFLKQQMEKSRSVALSPADVDKIVKEMRDRFGFDNSERDNVKKMLELIDKVVNKKIKSERIDEVWDSLARGARSILEGVYEVDASLVQENEAFIKHIRSTPLSVPSDNESDLPGGYGDYRNENRKYVNLSRNGTPIDSVYNEICEQFPGMLDRTIANPADMVEEIVHVMKSLEPEDVPVYSDTIDQASNEFVNALIAKYMNTAQKTYAQKLRDKADEIRKDNADRRVEAEVNRVQSEADRMEKSYQRYIESINKKNERQHQQTVTAYEARLNSIENAAARDAQEYERIINRYKDIEEAREFAGDRKEYARRIRQDARAIRSAAVSPNQKKFIPEKYRENVERIAVWLDRVSVLGRNIHKDNASEAAFAFVRSDFQALTELFGDDFYSIASGLLGQMEFYSSDLTQMESKDLKAAIFYRDAYKLGRLMRKSIADMNKVYLLEKRVAASMVANEITETLNHRRSTQKEFESLADKGQTGKFSTNFKKVVNFAYNRNLSFTDARTFFHRMGKAGDGIYETLRSAQSRQYLYIKQYTDKVGDALDDVDLSRYAGSKQKMVNITLSNGKEFTLTAAQAMNIVTLYERAAGKSHIENGGVRIYNPATKQASKATALTEKDIVSLRNALDETDKKVMRVLSDFMRNECTAWGNEATMEKYGFHRFTTKDYFPISVDRTATGADMKSYAPAQFNVENVGFAKPTKDNASAPVMIDSMIDVANNHIRGMASYAAYLNAEDGINRIMKVPGVVDTMKRALGSEAEKYITEMMNDLKGAGKTEALANNTVDYLNKFAGRYKAAAVSYNASTVAKQPLSYLRAAAVLNEKYLIKGAVGNRKQAFEEMMKYSGIAVRKEIGYSDVGVGKTIGEQIGYTEKGTLKSGVRKFNEFGMAGAALADRVTWESIWLACKAEQLEKNASAAIDNDALMKATAKRFEEVIAQTQVVDSALDSAPVSRSNNPLVRLTYAFMSEPIKGYNLFGSALDDFFNSANKADKKRAGKHLAKVVAYTLIGWAAEAAITSAFSAIRDDDDDFADKFKDTYFANIVQNASGVFPQIDPIVDIFTEVFSGYTPTNMADQTIIDVVSSVLDAYNIIKDPDGKRETVPKAIRDVIESASTMLGIPMKNIVRIVNNIAKNTHHFMNAYVADYKVQKFWYNPNNNTAREKNGFNSILADAYLSGDKEAFEYIYEDMRKMGLKPQQLVNSIAKDAYADDIADSEKSTLVKYTPGSEPWYIGMKTIFGRDEDAPKATEDEITRVYKASGETSVLPKFKEGKYTVDGTSKEFEGDALDKYLDDYGKLYYEVANAMRDLAAYRKGTVEEQAWWLTKAEKYASAVAVYMQDDSYSVTTVGKWVVDYIDARPVYVAKYIVGNLKPKKE